MTFRFGNNSTVSSNRAMLIPIGPVWLRIAIVDSRTPFLISNTVFRSLGAIIDTQGHIVDFKKLNCSVPLKLSDRRLFMLSIAELIQSAEKVKRVQCEPADQGSDKPIVLHVTEQTETQNSRKEPEPSSESSSLTPTVSNPKRTQEESVNLGPHENSTIIPSAQPVSVQQGSPDMQDQPLKTDGVRDKSNPSSDVISHGQQHAVSLQGSSEEHGGDRPGRRLVGNGHHHTATSDHEVWDSKAGTRVPRGGEGCKVLFMVPGSLPGLTEASSQGVSSLPAPLHRDDRGSPGRTKTNHRKERCGLQEPQHEGLSQGQSQEFYGTWHTLPDGDRGRRVHGHGGLVTGDGGTYGTSRRPTRSCDSNGVSHESNHVTADTDPNRTVQPCDTQCLTDSQSRMIAQACEEFNAYLETFDMPCRDKTKMTDPKDNPILKELWEHLERQGLPKTTRGRIDLLEIYCSEDSPLSSQGKKQGMTVHRFSISQGDLRTHEGRSRLYRCADSITTERCLDVTRMQSLV